jgi:hypothetical protein
MKTNYKHLFYILGLTFLMLLVLTACFSPWKGNEVAFTIRIGDSADEMAAGRSVWDREKWHPDDHLANLRHTVTLSGDSGPEQTRALDGSQAGYFFATPGDWVIDVESYIDEVLIAVGSENVEIYQGMSGPVIINMKEPDDLVLALVIFENNMGTVVESQRVYTPKGTRVSQPPDPIIVGSEFIGWYWYHDGVETEWDFAINRVLEGEITLFALWDHGDPSYAVTVNIDGIVTSHPTLEEALDSIPDGETAIVTVFAYQELPATNIADRNISIIPGGASRTIQLTGQGSLFTVDTGGMLILEGASATETLTLRGVNDNNAALIAVNTGGVLILNNNATITGNTRIIDFGSGAGVRVEYDGIFTMNGGTIAGNTAAQGGGVFVSGSGVFNMSGGTITGNITDEYDGGGVYVGGTFNMSGNAIIEGNTAGCYGGGVFVRYGTFNMSGGIITGNTAEHYGDGVYVESGTFTMSGGARVHVYNDVFLWGNSTIDIDAEFTPAGSSDDIANITPDQYTPNRQVLSGSGTLVADNFHRFVLTQPDGEEWEINAYGTLVKDL